MKHLKLHLICVTILSFHSIVYAQNQDKYNLDFDEYDSINQTLPNGWFKWGDFKSVSRENLGNEKYAIKVVSDQKGKFGTVTYRVPVNYVGDTITLTGRIKHENVKGYVGLFMRINSNNGSSDYKSMQNLKIKGTKDWKEYAIKLPLHSTAQSIYVAGILSGTGTAWFDDFRVTIDGENVETLEETPKLFLKDFNKDILDAALNQASMPIDLTTEDTFSLSLNGLIESLADKRIVAIGESTHGTSEFYRLREIITKRLIEEKGFNLVVLESPYDDIEILNKGLSKSPLDSLMKEHLFSIYQTQEMKSFLEWYKDNRFNYDIEFKGSDDSFWVFYELLTDHIGLVNDKKLEKLLADLKSNIAKGTTAKLKTSVAIYHNIMSIEKYLETTETLTNPLKEVLFNGKSTFINYVNMKNKKPIQTRDEIMADRISYLAKNKNKKIIVWAHNAHISNEIIVDNEIGIMGRDLKQEFGDDYHSIALTTLEGQYSFIAERLINGDHNYREILKQSDLQSLEVSLWENLLASYGNAFYLDISTFKKKLNTDGIIGSTRLIGYREETKQDVYEIQLTKGFDSVIFIKKTNATKPLKD
ncbi:erythromycin esterase family protein [uncultured Roseivirga sp.]|uniref:erythromycin esterase family protein n=1 Tax=uncultured Roseivirga sp. TaxID=543088 RepID=UPI0030D761BB|tara:strand:- start:108971 stop:110731 length:1761 start_codon:yes stop_codon:yes gene_type:complete